LTRLLRSFKAERADERIEIIDDALIEAPLALWESTNQRLFKRLRIVTPAVAMPIRSAFSSAAA
jgi:hypothetical protein